MNHFHNPAFDYDSFGQEYTHHRQTDPRIAAYVLKELKGMNTILNVGAGAGSYEPNDKYVVAVEPSKVMRAQRIATGKKPALEATAETLPFDDDSFDACMAIVTVHHWPDIEKGLKHLRRIARKKVIVMTFDPDCLNDFWNAEYFPELIEIEKNRYPKNELVVETLGGNSSIVSVPVPHDCVDGFQEAFFARPEAFLDKAVRTNQSAWGFLPDGKEDELVKRLHNDLTSGQWDEKHGAHRTMPAMTCALKLIIASY
mgnify:CR=1 FL=1